MDKQIISHFNDAIAVLKLENSKMVEIAGRKEATKWGIVILVVPPVANFILAALNFSSGIGVIFSRFLLWPIFIPVLSIVGTTFLISFVAKSMFKGAGNHIAFFNVIAYSGAVLWITIIPFFLAFLGFLDAFGLFNLISIASAIWMLVVTYRMLMIHHKLNQQDATVTIVAGIIGFAILKSLLGGILVGDSYRFWY